MLRLDRHLHANVSGSKLLSITILAMLLSYFLIPLQVVNAATNPFAFNDGTSTAVGTTETTIGTLSTTFAAGQNYVVAVVQCENTAASTTTITAGNLKLKDGATVLRSSAFAITLSSGSPNNHKWWVAQAVEASAPLNVAYTVTVLASQTGMNCEEKMLAIAGVTASIVAGSSTTCGTSDTTLATLSPSGIAAGDNALITTFEFSNTAGGARTIAAGNMKVKDAGGTDIGDNQFVERLTSSGTPNANYQAQLVPLYRAGDAANPSYSATCLASVAGSINGVATIALINLSPNGLQGNGLDGGSVGIGTSATTIGTLTPTNIANNAHVGVIASEQFDNTAGSTRNIAASANTLQQAGSSTGQAVNEFQQTLPATGASDDARGFALLDLFTAGADNPTYSTAAAASATGVNGETKILILRGTADWVRSDSESPTVSDSISKMAGKFPSDSPPISDSQARVFHGSRAVSETPPLSDLASKFFQGFRSLSESLVVALSDTVARLLTAFRGLSETPTVSDVVARVFVGSRGLSEDLSSPISDALARVFTGFRSISETPAISDDLARVFTGFRSMAESLAPAITDTISKTAGKFPSETTVISDVVSRIFTGFRSTAENLSSTISDTADRVFTGFRGLSESLAAMSDSISKGAGKFVSETPSLSDIVDRLFTGFRSTSEDLSATISDTITRVATLARSLQEDLSSITDTVSKAAGKFLSESSFVSDVAARLFTGFRGTAEDLGGAISDTVTRVAALARSIPEDLSAALSDSISRLFTGFRTLSDTPTISDALSRVFTGFRGISEDLTSAVSDTISKGAGKFLSETPSLSDVVDRLFSGFRSTSEDLSAAISDTLTRVATLARTLPEDLSGISDAISKAAGKFVSETLLISDVADRLLTGFRSTSENLAAVISDTITRVATLARTIPGDLSVITDSLGRVLTGIRAISETPAISDVAGRLFTGFRGLSENFGAVLSDTVVRSLTAARGLAEDLSGVISDTVTKSFVFVRGLSENLSTTLSDTVSRVFTGSRGITENLAAILSDTVSRIFPRVVDVLDSFVFSDSISSIINRIRAVADTYIFTSSASRLINQLRSVMDVFPFSDSVPLGRGLINAFMVMIIDSFTFNEAPTRAVNDLRSVLDSFLPSELSSLASNAVRGIVDSFKFGDLLNNSACPTCGLSAFLLNPIVMTVATVSALAVAIAIFFGREKIRCPGAAVAVPFCRLYGDKHLCRGAHGHSGLHRCKCDTRW